MQSTFKHGLAGLIRVLEATSLFLKSCFMLTRLLLVHAHVVSYVERNLKYRCGNMHFQNVKIYLLLTKVNNGQLLQNYSGLGTQAQHCIHVFHYFVSSTHAYKSRFKARVSIDQSNVCKCYCIFLVKLRSNLQIEFI